MAGDHWEPVSGFNDHPLRNEWVKFGTPDGEFLHSILVDPRDPAHLYISVSIGGTFESTDAGKGWTPINQGIEADFLPTPDTEYGHDPHCAVLHPLNPDRLYQQNHCGLYRLDRPARRWVRIGQAMPKKIGDIGFPIVVHPRDPDTAWVVPDGRHQRVAPYVHRRQTGCLPHAGRWQVVAAPRCGVAGTRLVHRAPPGILVPTMPRAPACTSGPPGARSGPAPTRATGGRASRAICRKSIRSRIRCDAMPTVRVASPLRSYTRGAATVQAAGSTLAEVLADLDARYPGMRFRMIDEQDRIRRHIRLFVNTDEASDLVAAVHGMDEVHLVCALSGG